MVKKKNSLDKMHLSDMQLKKWVIKLLKRKLSQPETSVLAKRINFAVASDRIPVDIFILRAEKACNIFKKEEVGEKQQLRADVRGVLKSTKSPNSNIKEERAALKYLGKDRSILIHPADNGKATVVMDKEEYEMKVRYMLVDERAMKN